MATQHQAGMPNIPNEPAWQEIPKIELSIFPYLLQYLVPIEGVAQFVADIVDRDDVDEDRQAGEDGFFVAISTRTRVKFLP